MAEVMEVYKCEVCGNIVEVLHGGAGELVCCDQPMVLYKENTTDAAVEKHVPVVEKSADTVKVTVGEVPHPMTEEHYIEWIELLIGDRVYRQFLKPGDEPDALFPAPAELFPTLPRELHPTLARHFTARAYCNLHGLWKGE